MSSPSFIKNLMKDGLIYGITRYVGVIAAIFLTPIYTRIIPRHDYGIMDIFNVWITLFSLLIPMGLIQALPRLWMDSRNDKVSLKNIIGNFNLLIIAFSLVFLLLTYSLKSTFEKNVLHSTAFGHIYYLTIFIAVIQVIYNQQLAIFRQVFKRRKFVAVSLLNLFLLTVLGFTLVYHIELGIQGFFYASIISLLITVSAALVLNREYLCLRFDKSLLRSMLSYSTPLLYVAAFFSLSDLTDRFIINSYLGTEEVGLYSVAARIASIPLFFTTAFATAWFPRIFNINDVEERNSLLIKTHNIAILFFGSVFMAVVLFKSELIRFFAPDYTDAFQLVILLSLSYIINGVGPIYAVGIHLLKSTGDLLKGALISVVVNVFFSILLLKFYGIEGVAMGTLFGALLWTILRYFYGQKKLKIQFDFNDLYVLLPAFAAVLYISYILEDIAVMNIILKSVAGLIIGFFVLRRMRKYLSEDAEVV